MLIGFAAESNELINNARNKMKEKNLDMIIVNDISKSETGFGSDENEITIITKKSIEEVPVMSKRKLSNVILDKIIEIS